MTSSNKSESLSKPQIFGLLAFGIIAIISYAFIDSGGSSSSESGEPASTNLPVESSASSPTVDVPRLVPLDGSVVPADRIGLRVFKLEDGIGRCDVYSEAYNNTDQVVQNLHLRVQVHDKSGMLIEAEPWWYENVRPARSVIFEMSHIENVPCSEIGNVEISAMRCVIGGAEYSAQTCVPILSFPDGLLEWSI